MFVSEPVSSEYEIRRNDMAKFIDKIMDAMKLSDYEDEPVDYKDDYNDFTGEPEPVRSTPEPRPFKSYTGGKASTISKPTVMNLQANVQMEVVLIQPTTFNEAQEICDNIKAKKPCIMNFEKLDHPTAQRIMDFVSGACYTLDGSIKRVNDSVFIIAPVNVDVLGNFEEELKSNGIIQWDKY